MYKTHLEEYDSGFELASLRKWKGLNGKSPDPERVPSHLSYPARAGYEAYLRGNLLDRFVFEL